MIPSKFSDSISVDDYFIICTLGIPGIPAIRLFGMSFEEKIPFLLLSVCFVAVVWYALHNLTQSGFGRTLTAISEDEIYTQSIGKNVRASKIVSFTLSAMLAAIPGVLYAHYITYIDPTSFTVNESIFILSIVIIGGLGNLRGSMYAAAFMMLLPEALRFVGLPSNVAVPKLPKPVYAAVDAGILEEPHLKILSSGCAVSRGRDLGSNANDSR